MLIIEYMGGNNDYAVHTPYILGKIVVKHNHDNVIWLCQHQDTVLSIHLVLKLYHDIIISVSAKCLGHGGSWRWGGQLSIMTKKWGMSPVAIVGSAILLPYHAVKSLLFDR